jgi:hypothetical protein
MTRYTPTIEELMKKPASELEAIFRKAAEIASGDKYPAQERDVARRTMENVRRCLPQTPTP